MMYGDYYFLPKPSTNGVPYKTLLIELVRVFKPEDLQKCILKRKGNTIYVDSLKLLSFFKYVRTEYNDDPEVDWEECICGVKIKEVNYILYNSQEYKVGSVCIEGWSNLIDLSNAYKEFHKIGEFKEYHSCDFCNRKIKEEGNHKACEGKRDLKNIFRTWVYYTKEVKKCKKMMDLLGDVAVVFGKYRDDKIANVYNDRNYLNWLNIKYGELHICKLKGLIGSLLSDIEKYDFERQKYLLCKDDYQNYCDEILSAKLGLCRILIE